LLVAISLSLVGKTFTISGLGVVAEDASSTLPLELRIANEWNLMELYLMDSVLIIRITVVLLT